MSATLSNMFVILYAASTLLLRLFLEPQLQGNFLISVGLGALAILFLWSLIKSKLIRPTLLNLDNIINGKEKNKEL